MRQRTDLTLRQCSMTLDATRILTDDDLAAALARCGVTSTSASQTPGWIWVPWTWEWRGSAAPLARALVGPLHEGFVVAIHHGGFQIYELDRQNDWYHVVGELQGAVSEHDLTEFFHIATLDVPFVERNRRLRETHRHLPANEDP